jgi:hypothetical protein
MANGTGGSITSFFTIWTEPRATIRRIVDTDPTRHVVALAATGPAIGALSRQWSKALDSNAHLSVLWPIEVAFTVVLWAAVGVLSLFISGVILKWSGSLLGGVASRVEMRAALAWSQVPAIAGEIVVLIAVLSGIPIPHPTPGSVLEIDPAFYKVIVAEGVLALWGGIVGLYCIAEVHRFSAWRALCTTLIPGLISMIVLGFAVFVAYSLAAHH